MTYSINVDTGGTFTDVYASGPRGISVAKADTTPHDLTIGILESIGKLAETWGMGRSELLREMDIVRFSTTIGTNTLVTRSGPRVGLVVSAELRREIGGRFGDEVPISEELVQEVDEGAEDIGDQITRAVRSVLERGARIIVIALHGGADLAERELGVRQAIAEEYPRHYLGAVPVLSSHQVTLHPDARLRVQTAILNAYLHPVMSRVLYRAEDQLKDDSYRNPLLVATGDAGTARVAKTTAIRTFGSGPAGAMAGATELAERLDLERVVLVDVGGTTSDIGGVFERRWRLDPEPQIGGVEIATPFVDLTSIGVGGGSIARFNDGVLEVGPESAGALPGPASFGLGGTDATVTDAALHSGMLEAHRFLGGRRVLDEQQADRVLRELASGLGTTAAEAAGQVLDRAAHTIADAILVELAARDEEAAGTVLFATGGGGGLFAFEVARRAGLAAAYVFPFNATFSAFGLCCLDVQHSYEFTLEGTESEEEVSERIEELKGRAVRDMHGEGFDTDELRFWVEYQAEGGEYVAIPLGGGTGGGTDQLAVKGQFRLLSLKAAVPARTVEFLQRESGSLEPMGERAVAWGDGDKSPTPVYDWDAVPISASIPGPAILEREDCTVLIPPDCVAEIGELGEARLIPAAVAGGGGDVVSGAEVPER